MRRNIHTFGKLAGGVGLVVFGWLAGQTLTLLQAQSSSPKSALPDYDRNVVAYVNSVPITRLELSEELIARRGKQHLELMINRKIIEQACQKANIIVSDAEVEADLREITTNGALFPDQKTFEKFLKQEKLTLFEYKEDIIRKGIATRKLANARVQVTEEDLKKAFAANFGEKVKCRAIVLPASERKQAQQVYQKVRADAKEFERQARQQENLELASKGGEVFINRHSSMPEVEQQAFALGDGEVSHMIEVNGELVILLREKLVPADATRKLDDPKTRELLTTHVTQSKLRLQMATLFKELRQQAVVHDYLNHKHGLKEVVEHTLNGSSGGAGAKPQAASPDARRAPK